MRLIRDTMIVRSRSVESPNRFLQRLEPHRTMHIRMVTRCTRHGKTLQSSTSPAKSPPGILNDRAPLHRGDRSVRRSIAQTVIRPIDCQTSAVNTDSSSSMPSWRAFSP